MYLQDSCKSRVMGCLWNWVPRIKAAGNSRVHVSNVYINYWTGPFCLPAYWARSLEQRTMSWVHSVVSQASVCHTKPFPFVEVIYWREVTIGVTEVRRGERWGRIWIFLCAWAAQSSQAVFASMGDFLKKWTIKIRGLIHLSTIAHFANSWEPVPPDELFQRILAVGNITENTNNLQLLCS